MTDYKQLCAELVAIEDALSGGVALASNQGQALDGYSALANFRSVANRARAALAQPEPEGPTDEELSKLLYNEFTTNTGHGWHEDVIGFARAILARWGRPTPQPIPVSERLPGPEPCWWFTPEGDEEYGWWVLETDGMEREPQPTHWLPAHALPVPPH